MSIQFDYLDAADNPLDNVECILEAQNWVFNRMSDEELMVRVTGKAGSYNLYFVWQSDLNALQFCAQYDFSINAKQLNKAAQVLMSVNENLWIGHFEIHKETKTPAFRHACLYRGLQLTGSSSYLEDLVDIALAECEKHYAAFYMLSHANDAHDQNLALALMETLGES
ncbi:MAG: YbjN domain-containing protein [Alphaproteobacteria bacterium]